MPSDRASSAGADPRQQTIDFWVSKGAPEHVAQGIADRVAVESGFNPLVPGAAGEIGLYQHLGSRKTALEATPGWQNPLVQHQFAYGEVTGGDPIATRHWKDILAAPNRTTAAMLWDRYFERSAGSGAGGNSLIAQRGGLLGQSPDFAGLADRLRGSPINALSPTEVANSTATPPAATAGNLTPGAPLASAVALMALANAGTHKIEPVYYDPFKRMPTAVLVGEVPSPTASMTPPGPGVSPVLTGAVRQVATSAPTVATIAAPAFAPIRYVTRTGMRSAYEAPGLNLSDG